MLGLKLPTDPRWVNIVEKNVEEILTDHAYCEQKAASTAISLIIGYPEYSELVDEMTLLAQEEIKVQNKKMVKAQTTQGVTNQGPNWVDADGDGICDNKGTGNSGKQFKGTNGNKGSKGNKKGGLGDGLAVIGGADNIHAHHVVDPLLYLDQVAGRVGLPNVRWE